MRWKTAALVLGFLIFALPGHALAQVPPLIRYQGTLTDGNGAPLTGSHNLTFRFYDAAIGGTKMWEEIQTNIPLTQGAFSVLLGQVAPLSLNFDINCWMAVSVDGAAELTPRTQVASVPNAYLSAKADQLARSEGVQPGNLVKNGSFESWSTGVSAAPDQWSPTGGAALAKETTFIKLGLASASLSRVGADATLNQDVTARAGGVSYIPSRTYTFSAWVKATVPSRTHLSISDGVGSSYSVYHTGGGAFELLTITRTLDPAATKLQVALEITGGDANAWVDGAALVEGGAPFAFRPHPNDEQIRISNFKKSIGDITWLDKTDQGEWRMEMGEFQVTLTANGVANNSVPFERAFRTVRIALITSANPGYQGFWQVYVPGTWGINVRVDNGPPNTTVNAYWVAIGQD